MAPLSVNLSASPRKRLLYKTQIAGPVSSLPPRGSGWASRLAFAIADCQISVAKEANRKSAIGNRLGLPPLNSQSRMAE